MIRFGGRSCHDRIPHVRSQMHRCYEARVGFVTAIDVRQDATETAQARMLAVTKAIGGPQKAAIEVSVQPEALVDLMSTMRALAEGITSGRFADEGERERGYPHLQELKEPHAGPFSRELESDPRRRLGPGCRG
jgi:ketol-acid reductoisomerase